MCSLRIVLWAYEKKKEAKEYELLNRRQNLGEGSVIIIAKPQSIVQPLCSIMHLFMYERKVRRAACIYNGIETGKLIKIKIEN